MIVLKISERESRLWRRQRQLVRRLQASAPLADGVSRLEDRVAEIERRLEQGAL